jgi:hypothetical protein
VKNLTLAVWTFAIVAGSAIAGQGATLGVEGAVSTADAAVKIARAVAVSRFGEAVIQREEPLSAKLDVRNNWVVTGTMPPGSLGGVVEVEIARRDGRVLRLIHGQ